MKTKQVVETNVDDEGVELLYCDGAGKEKTPETLEELINAVESSLEYLQEDIRNDLLDIWKRLDGIENRLKAGR